MTTGKNCGKRDKGRQQEKQIIDSLLLWHGKVSAHDMIYAARKSQDMKHDHPCQSARQLWNKYGDLCNHHEHIIQINWHLQGLCILLRHIIRNEHKDETYSYLMYLGLLPVYLNCLFILIVKFLHIWNRHSLSINNYLRWWHNCSRELSIARYAPVEVGLAACPQLCHSQPEKISSLLICIMYISLSTSESMTAYFFYLISYN